MIGQNYVNRLNLHARQLLQHARQPVDPSVAPVFLLMEWAQPHLEFQDRYRDALEGTLQNLQGWPNQEEAVLELVNSNDQSEETRVSREFFRESNPVKAAFLLWDALHSKLGAEEVSYHRAD